MAFLGFLLHLIHLQCSQNVSDRVIPLKDPKLRMTIDIHLDNGLTEFITHTDIFVQGKGVRGQWIMRKVWL